MISLWVSYVVLIGIGVGKILNCRVFVLLMWRCIVLLV